VDTASTAMAASHLLHHHASSPLSLGGNPRISAPLQNTSLGSGAGLSSVPSILKPKCHQFIIRDAILPLFCFCFYFLLQDGEIYGRYSLLCLRNFNIR
jgi:hypothetical protein